jgi:hypothetical protein
MRWLSVKVTNHCPHECSYCVSGSNAEHPRWGVEFVEEEVLTQAAQVDAVEITGGEPLREALLAELLYKLHRDHAVRINLLTAGSRNRHDRRALQELRVGDHVHFTHHISERDNEQEIRACLYDLPSGVDATVKVLGLDEESVRGAMQRWTDVRVMPALVGQYPRPLNLPWPDDYPRWLSLRVRFDDGSEEVVPPARAIHDGFTRVNGWKCSAGTVINEWGMRMSTWCNSRQLGRCQARFCDCGSDLLLGVKVSGLAS